MNAPLPQPAPAPAIAASEGVRAFARRLGCRPGYVTELRRMGRLVLSDDGRAIRIAESLARIEATRDPSKAGVRHYHAKARQNAPAARLAPGTEDGRGAVQVAASGAHSAISEHPAAIAHPLPRTLTGTTPTTPPANIAANGPASLPAPVSGAGQHSATGQTEIGPDDLPEGEYALRRARALAAKEESLARKAQREELIELGTLLARDEVLAAISEAGVQFRMRLEQLPATLAPQLAASADEGQVRVLLRDALDGVLAALSHAFAAMATPDPAP